MLLKRIILVGTGFGLTAMAGANVIDQTAPDKLQYHLIANTNVTSDTNGNVSAWGDANTNGVVFNAASSTQDATLNSSSAAFNNQPTIHFNGDLSNNANGEAPNASSLVENQSTSAVTVFIVESITSMNNLSGIWGANQGDTGIRRNSSSNWQTKATGNNNDFPASMRINSVPTTAQPSDGTAVVMTAVGSDSFVGNLGDYFHVGTNTPRVFQGDIAEMAVYNGTLSADQTQAIETYLELTYSTPEPGAAGIAGVGAASLLLLRRRRLSV